MVSKSILRKIVGSYFFLSFPGSDVFYIRVEPALFFLLLELIQFSQQQIQSNFAIGFLVSFTAGCDDNSGTFMSESDCRRYFIDILATVPSASKKLPLEIRLINAYLRLYYLR